MQKAFEKQTKTIEGLEKRQVDENEKLLKYKETFDELSKERIGEIYSISKQIDFKNLVYYFKSKDITTINFLGFRGPMHVYNSIKNGNTSIEKTRRRSKSI